MNRLGRATSPYLQQHADNPVDWWEWGDAAFAEARRRDVPLLVSIGYAACHWCHVMAHESFEDPATAAVMNAGFVCVKVDREELPGVDAVYMTATQAMTGQGGWPMTVFATPDGQPFHCGTYFPPTQRAGMPAFRQVLDAVSAAWRDRRDEVVTGSARITAELARHAVIDVTAAGAGEVAGSAGLDADTLDTAFRQLVDEYDEAHGGFGGAPKFPPAMALEYLLRHHARTGDATALGMVVGTCDAMARGGMYDQLGGGFARYAVDADWVVPHFEKMLYDNALLLRVYLHLYRATNAPLPRRIAVETLDFMLRELRTAEGGFASSLDADTEGAEGRFYAWSPAALREVLGEADGAWAARVFDVTEPGTFEHGTSVLQLRGDPDDPDRFATARAALFAARERRVRPGRDDKVVAAWNGLAIAALAEAAVLLDRADALDAAIQAAALAVGTHLVAGRLRRTSRAGVVGEHQGVLEDYGCLAEGLLTLYGVTGEPRWFEVASELLSAARAGFLDEATGHWFDTALDADQPLFRPSDPSDNATPSGASAVAAALVSLTAYTGSADWRAAAEFALRGTALLASRAPRFAGAGLAVAEAMLDGPREVAVVGAVDDPRTADLRRIVVSGTAPGLVLAVGAPTASGDAPSSPLLRDRGLLDDRPAAYVCRGFVCDAPTSDPKVLAAAVGTPRR